MKMIKENKVTFIITTILTLLPMIIGIILWNKLPDQMATHFNYAGEPDQYSSKAFAVFFFGSFLVVIHLVCSFATSLGTFKGKELSRFPIKVCLWLCPIIAVFVSGLMYTNALGMKLDITFWAMIYMAVLFLVLGNYLPKAQQNHFFGTRVKWTLESKKNWNHTHRFTAWLMCSLGILFLIMAFTGVFRVFGNIWGPVFVISIVLVFALGSVLYSYVYYKKHKEDEDYYE